MDQYIKVESDHIHLFRGGHILISCQWIEKIMVDLIILKMHPKIHRRFNMPLPYIIPRIMIEERQKFWKKDFWEIKKEFFKLFDPDIVIRKKIEKVNVIRNILSHSNVKLGQKFFLYSPKNGQKLTEAWTALNLTKVNDQFKPIVLKTDYSLEINYLHDFEIIQSLDQEYFSKEADKLGIIYSHIR